MNEIVNKTGNAVAKNGAKEQERHRQADGGQISWYKESKRRHGVLEKPEEGLSIRGLLGREPSNPAEMENVSPKSQNEEAIEARRNASRK